MVHIGIIPDGNRRWCQKNNINFYNHNNDIIVNYEKIIIDFINKHEYLKNKKRIPKHLKNITEVSFYISSIDNMKRIDNTKYIVLNLIKYIYEIYKDPKQYLDKMNIDYTDEQYNNIDHPIEFLVKRAKILISCHGSLQQSASSFRIKILDIFFILKIIYYFIY